MSDYSELKRLAEAVNQTYADLCEHGGDQMADAWDAAELAYDDAANPAVVLALLAENESLKGSCKAIGKDMAKVTRERNSATAQVNGLKAENEALRKAIQAIAAQVDGNIRPTVRDYVNGQNHIQDIHGYCDQIEAIAAAAMKEPQP